jgi:NAD+ kinase
MRVVIHGKKFSKESAKYIIEFIIQLEKFNIDVLYMRDFYENLKKRINYDNKINVQTISNVRRVKKKINFFISFGGDGTILNAATLVQDLDIPIIGINTGRLGFLATIAKHEINNLLKALINKKYRLSERALINTSSKDMKFSIPFALNEISVSAKENTSMINIKVFLNNEYLNTYWADGLIVSTPTGSTGYSLSCGGPIVLPKSNNFIITPIAPHNLNVRPLVISDDTIIRIEILDNNSRKFLVSMDSRHEYLKNSSAITLKKAKFNIKLLELETNNYSQTLREKLLWGLDTRNNT